MSINQGHIFSSFLFCENNLYIRGFGQHCLSFFPVSQNFSEFYDFCEGFWVPPTPGEELGEEKGAVDMVQP